MVPLTERFGRPEHCWIAMALMSPTFQVAIAQDSSFSTKVVKNR